jgi:hypothetical protein
MNKEKAKILLRLYKEDLISADEFFILFEETPVYINKNDNTYPYTITTSTPDPNFRIYYPNSSNGVVNNLINTPNYSSSDQKTTISSNLHKAFFDSEASKLEK